MDLSQPSEDSIDSEFEERYNQTFIDEIASNPQTLTLFHFQSMVGNQCYLQFRTLCLFLTIWFINSMLIFSFVYIFDSPSFLCTEQNPITLLITNSLCHEGKLACKNPVIYQDNQQYSNSITNQFLFYCSGYRLKYIIQGGFFLGGILGVYLLKAFLLKLFGFKRVLIIIMFLQILSNILIRFSESFLSLLAGFFFSGFFVFQIYVSLLVYLRGNSSEQFFLNGRTALYMTISWTQILSALLQFLLKDWQKFFLYFLICPQVILLLIVIFYFRESILFSIIKTSDNYSLFQEILAQQKINQQGYFFTFDQFLAIKPQLELEIRQDVFCRTFLFSDVFQELSLDSERQSQDKPSLQAQHQFPLQPVQLVQIEQQNQFNLINQQEVNALIFEQIGPVNSESRLKTPEQQSPDKVSQVENEEFLANTNKNLTESKQISRSVQLSKAGCSRLVEPEKINKNEETENVRITNANVQTGLTKPSANGQMILSEQLQQSAELCQSERFQELVHYEQYQQISGNLERGGNEEQQLERENREEDIIDLERGGNEEQQLERENREEDIIDLERGGNEEQQLERENRQEDIIDGKYTKKFKSLVCLIGAVQMSIYISIYLKLADIGLELGFNQIIISVAEVVSFLTADKFINFTEPRKALTYNLVASGIVQLIFNITQRSQICAKDQNIFCPERIIQVLLCGILRFTNIFSFSFLFRHFKITLLNQQNRMNMWYLLMNFSLLGALLPYSLQMLKFDLFEYFTVLGIVTILASLLCKFL